MSGGWVRACCGGEWGVLLHRLWHNESGKEDVTSPVIALLLLQFLSGSLSLHFPQGFSIAKEQVILSEKVEDTHMGQHPPASARALGWPAPDGWNGQDGALGAATAAAAAAATLGLR